MLIGQYEGKIGVKHQLSLPKKFRETLGNHLIATKGFENCLIVVSQDNWETLLEGTQGLPFTNLSARQLQRFLLGNASDIELDVKGRFIVPEYLRDFAQIQTDVIFAGIQRFIEIWSKDLWIEHQSELSKNIESIAQKLSKEGTGNE